MSCGFDCGWEKGGRQLDALCSGPSGSVSGAGDWSSGLLNITNAESRSKGFLDNLVF